MTHVRSARFRRNGGCNVRSPDGARRWRRSEEPSRPESFWPDPRHLRDHDRVPDRPVCLRRRFLSSRPPWRLPRRRRAATEAQPTAKAWGRDPRAGNEADAGTLDRYRLALIVAAKSATSAIRRRRWTKGGRQGGGPPGRRRQRCYSGRHCQDFEGYGSGQPGPGHGEECQAPGADPVRLRGREFTVDIPVIFDAGWLTRTSFLPDRRLIGGWK